MPRQDELILRYAVNMDRDGDRRLVFNGNKGLTGTCYSRRRPYLCNLEILSGWASAEGVDPQATLLGMVPGEHLRVRGDRTWMINVPIFDPQDSWFLDEPPERKPQEADAVWAELQIDRDGGVLGVLNVDGAIPYNELAMPKNPEDALNDARTKCILSLLWACSIDIGRVLSRAFARKENDDDNQRP